MDSLTCSHCGRTFRSRAGLAGHWGGLAKAGERMDVLRREAKPEPPRAWFRTDQGNYVGSSPDGRPWVAYPIDLPRP